MKIKLKDVHLNPYRDLSFNPLNEQKILTLMSSIKTTGFWANTILRKSPDGKGYQAAYGAHRCEAARRSGITEAEFVVQELDDNLMLQMLERENSDDYRYCPLSLLESVKAVVSALAEERIAPFDHTVKTDSDYFEKSGGWSTAQKQSLRFAPSFIPGGKSETNVVEHSYTNMDIAKFLGYTYDTTRGYNKADQKITAALDALYLLEVKAITTASIKDMNWSQLGKFVADAKALRERTILRTVKTKDEINKLNAEALRVQAEHKERERKAEEKRKALVKKLAEAKREEDEKEKKKVQVKLEVLEDKVEEDEEVYKEKRKKIDDKVEQVKRVAEETKKEDLYLPVRKETDRIVHLLERRDEEEQIKALARKPLNPNDRERLRQAALTKGAWYTETVARWLVPPRNAKEDLVESAKREEANRRAESKGEQC